MGKIYGVIDIGSNSVRLMLSDGVNTLKKHSVTTRLAEGAADGVLQQEPIDRTVNAVAFLKAEALKGGASEIYAFATAAVRNSENGKTVCKKIEKTAFLTVDVLSGTEEAEIGFLGALINKDGGLIDVGGASSEIIVVKKGQTVYEYSLPVGAVTVTDMCGQNFAAADKFVSEKVKEYKTVPKAEFTAIGGTATSLAAVMQKLAVYDRNKTDGYKLYTSSLKTLADRLYSMSVEERKLLPGLQAARAEIIAGGALLLFKIADELGVPCLTVSERDNLEGYLIKKVGKQ